MSRHKKDGQAAATAEPSRSFFPSLPPAPELLRCAVLVLVIALVVARPLVPGDDPGLLHPLSGPAGLLFSFLWLAAGTLWAVWQVWTGRSDWHRPGEERGGLLLEAALLVVAGTAFLGAEFTASYQHPAWLIAWEWLILVVVFGLVRRLAATAEERQHLLAAVLATGVGVAVLAVYQGAVERPRAHATGTFGHPDSLADYLTLLLPAAAGFVVAAFRRWGRSWQPALAGVCVLLLGAALWLSHSQSALLALLLVGAVLGAVFWRRLPAPNRAGVVLGLVGLTAAVILLSVSAATVLGPESLRLNLETWSATWRMIVDHPWLGVGPGNFGRYYPQYKPPASFDYPEQPYNFALEVWATCGVVALAALLAALVLFFRAARGAWRVARQEEAAAPSSPAAPRPLFVTAYVGGMLGLLLAFLARATGGSGPDIIEEAVRSSALAVIWFAALALFSNIPLTGPAFVLSLVAGVAALLLNLTVAGGIAFPSVAQSLWTVMALVVAATAKPAGEHENPSVPAARRPPLAALLGLAALGAACLAYFLLVFSPAMDTHTHLSRARLLRQEYQLAVPQAVARSLDPLKRAGIKRTVEKIVARIGQELNQADQASPGDTRPRLESAQWIVEGAEGSYRIETDPTVGQPAEQKAAAVKMLEKYANRSLEFLQQVEQLDPLGMEGPWMEFKTRVWLAGLLDRRREEYLTAAGKLLDVLMERDRVEAAGLQLELAEAWFKAKEDSKGRAHAAEAARLDEEAEQAGLAERHRLKPPQLKQLQKWLARPGAGRR
jgi:O-antigen ligase